MNALQSKPEPNSDPEQIAPDQITMPASLSATSQSEHDQRAGEISSAAPRGYFIQRDERGHSQNGQSRNEHSSDGHAANGHAANGHVDGTRLMEPTDGSDASADTAHGSGPAWLGRYQPTARNGASPRRSKAAGRTNNLGKVRSARSARNIRKAQAKSVQDATWPVCRTLIVGACTEAHLLADELETHFPADYLVVGFVEDAGPFTQSAETKAPGPGRWQILGERKELPDLARRHHVEQIMIADFFSRDITDICPPLTEPPGDDLAAARPTFNAIAKRGFDIAFSLTMLGLTAPLIALTGLAVKLTSKGPVFYCQERVGRDGRPFTIYKLRTMIERAESETGPILARNGDPRSTPIGRVLRATKLDELPQLYNVLRGDMSVVGPRPERPHFVQCYNRHVPSYARRHTVRPGITGLAQVESGYRTHVYVKLQYDLRYIDSQSLWLDLWILTRTPLSILGGMSKAAAARWKSRPRQQRRQQPL